MKIRVVGTVELLGAPAATLLRTSGLTTEDVQSALSRPGKILSVRHHEDLKLYPGKAEVDLVIDLP